MSDTIKKAELALSDLMGGSTSNGWADWEGYLMPEQGDKFIRAIMDAPTILNACRFVTMNGPNKKVNKIGFGSRILKPATSITALTSGAYSSPTLDHVNLSTKEVIAEVRLPYDVLEDNIEGGNIAVAAGQQAGGLMDTVVTLIGERVALDLEELALLGDTSSTDSYLALHDGWLALASSHPVNAASATISKSIFKAGVKAMPDKYLRNRASMIHFISPDQETEYRDTVANRATATGDAYLQGVNDIYVFGSKVIGAPMMPDAYGLYCDPRNLLFGIQRKVSLEYDKDITKREFIIVVTARVAVQIEEADAVVKYYGIA